jgi:3-keto-5-aminohexanoate cleavage enzyme
MIRGATGKPALRDNGKVIIEVGLNETAGKDRNPNLPYGPDEVAKAAIEAARAGAAMVHFHARRDDGTQAWTDDACYREAMEAIAAECDILCYPTYPPRVPTDERFAHVWALADEPSSAPLELAPIDIGSRNVVLWDREREAFAPLDLLPADSQVAINSPAEIEWVLARAGERGLHPTLGIFDMTYLRYSVHALWAGLLRPPLLLKWFLTERWVSGTFPTPAGIDAYVSQVPDGVDYEGIVVPYAMHDPADIEALWRHGLDRNQSIRVGIGDNPDAFPHATNAELVERAVDLVVGRDLTPATPADVRHRLGLPVPAT